MRIPCRLAERRRRLLEPGRVRNPRHMRKPGRLETRRSPTSGARHFREPLRVRRQCQLAARRGGFYARRSGVAMGKVNAAKLRYLSRDDFRVLTAVRGSRPSSCGGGQRSGGAEAVGDALVLLHVAAGLPVHPGFVPLVGSFVARLSQHMMIIIQDWRNSAQIGGHASLHRVHPVFIPQHHIRFAKI